MHVFIKTRYYLNSLGRSVEIQPLEQTSLHQTLRPPKSLNWLKLNIIYTSHQIISNKTFSIPHDTEHYTLPNTALVLVI